MNKSDFQEDNYFRYGSYINYKAISDFHQLFNIDDEYFKPSHCMVLAFIIECYHKHENLYTLTIEKRKFVMLNTNFILMNLKYIKVGPRQVKKYIQLFKEKGIIDIFIHERTNRFIHVKTDLIRLYYPLSLNMSPTKFLRKFKPIYWQGFVNEWKPYFKDDKSFNDFIFRFDCERDIQGYSYDAKSIFKHLVNTAQFKVYGKGFKGDLKMGWN